MRILKKVPSHFLIPCYNDVETLPQLLEDIKNSFPWSRIILIDDGSIPKIPIQNFPELKLVRLENNCGVGSALKAGMKFALTDKATSIMTVDADGQHLISEGNKIIKESQGVLVSIGSRKGSDYDWGVTRKIAHNVLNRTVSFIARQNITDATSGFRLIKGMAISKTIELLEDDYLDDTALLLVRYASENIEIKEVQIQMAKRKMGKASHSGVRLIAKYFSILTRILLEKRPS